MDNEEFEKMVAFTDNLDRFEPEMKKFIKGLGDYLTDLVTEIEGGLIEAGYSPLCEGSKKEMYDRVEDARQDVLGDLFFLDLAMNEFRTLFAAIADAVDKEYGVRRRRSKMKSRACEDKVARQDVNHTKEG